MRPRRYGRPHLVATGVAIVVAGLLVGGGVAWATRPGGALAGLVPWAQAADVPSSAPAPAPATTTPVPDETALPAATTAAPTPTPTPTAVGIDLAQYSTTDAASLWVIVNKQHPIDPLTYEPPDLVWVSGAQVRAVVAPDLEAMLAAAQADGVPLGVRTGYRSYGFQQGVHADVVRRDGTAYADKYSARAGYSEHQTGLALDVHSGTEPSCDLKSCFPGTPEAAWVAAHAAEYGFVVRYTPENTATTGYSPEAWHLRYVGRELAQWMAANGVGSLEEAFGVTGGSDYAAD